MQSLTERLQSAEPLLLDGATGTELDRRGVNVQLPLWSAQALIENPDVLEEVHRSYVLAGAQVLTANTFRTHARNLEIHFGTEAQHQAVGLTTLAVEVARRAAGDEVYVLGSQAPLEDCYRPDRVPDEDSLTREHALMAEHLADAGVDGILVETQNCIREATAAARAAVSTGLPTLVSFVCGASGDLLSGETLPDAVEAILPLAPAAVLVNCGPTPRLIGCVETLRRCCPRLPVGAYGNIGEVDEVRGWRNTDAQDPRQYARFAQAWLETGARIIGGCCGTTPTHIQELQTLLRSGP